MANLLARLKGVATRDITTIDDYAELFNSFSFNGLNYGFGLSGSGIQQTLGGQSTEMAPNNFVGLASHAFASNGPVFACMMVRQLVFSSIRFTWQRLRNGKPSDTFGSSDLRLLERPWPGGTTQDLLSRIIQDADLAGNSYWLRDGNELVRLRPDWVHIVVEPREFAGRGQIGWRKIGYVYRPTGADNGDASVGLLADEVAHFAPIPDPLASYRGMSWLTPILREIQADQSMTHHQRKFFDQGATVNMVIKHPPGADPDAVQKWAEEMQSKHGGVRNAWKNLNLYPGADATAVGSNLKDIDFKEVRGGGETRIAAAAGVPPVIVGLSEGLAAATYSNYGQARRRLADGTAHPLWQNIAGSMEKLLTLPPGSDARLWYDATDVPFLREDEKDAADIAAVKASTIASYVTQGFTKESAVKAVDSGDINLLVDSGLTSVQLLPPGTPKPTVASSTGSESTPATNGQAQGGVLNGASN